MAHSTHLTFSTITLSTGSDQFVFYLSGSDTMSAHLEWTGSLGIATGSFWVSCKPSPTENTDTDWVPLGEDAPIEIIGDNPGKTILPLTNLNARWGKIKYVWTQGTSSIDCWVELTKPTVS